MGVLFLLAAVVGCVLARPSSENVTPVEVALYYESLCPGCQYFIPTQLQSTYTDTRYDFASLISKLTLVPYGWAKVRNATSHEYECQHGQSECEGNRLHACAINYITDEVTTLNYISCLENEALAAFRFGGSFKYPLDKCQNELPKGLYQKIIKCYNSEEGWKLFEKNGEKTTSFFKTHAFVPYVSFNNVQNDTLALAAIQNFRGTLCSVTGAVDKACSS